MEACRPEVRNVRKVYQDTLKEAKDGVKDYLKAMNDFNGGVRFRMISGYEPIWGLTPDFLKGINGVQ
jgi:hypothetical protein